MALSKKILWQKFNRTFSRNMACANSKQWEDVSFSFKPDADSQFSAEQEVTVEVSVKERKIVIEFSNRLQGVGKYDTIPFCAIEETLTQLAPDSYILKLEGGQQLKFKFGTRSAKESFEEAITISSSDSGQSDGSVY